MDNITGAAITSILLVVAGIGISIAQHKDFKVCPARTWDTDDNLSFREKVLGIVLIGATTVLVCSYLPG